MYCSCGKQSNNEQNSENMYMIIMKSTLIIFIAIIIISTF